MEFELRLRNDPRGLSTVTAFAGEALKHLSGDEDVRGGLLQLIEAATSDAITHAYPKGETGSILISLKYDDARMVISIRDYGLPQDLNRLEAALQSGDGNHRKQVLGLDWSHFADEMHWIGFGPDGKALQIIRWLHDTHIADHPEKGSLQPFAEETPLAPAQSYEIRRMKPEDALQISQLMYRGYGASYFNRDMYYPERVASLNETGVILSFVAVTERGEVVGHYALEKNQAGPVMEGGQAVVDPAHRGRKLLDRLKDAAIAEARRLKLVGMYGDAVTAHTYSQKINIDHGARLACADLGICPRTEIFRGIEKAPQPQRVSCMLYFLWLEAPAARTVFAPSVYRSALEKLYANLGCPVTFGEPAAPSGTGELSVLFDAPSQAAFIQVRLLGEDTAAAIRHTKRELIEKSHAEAIYVDLPLEQSGTPATAAALEKEGFWFGGVAPHFSRTGDYLRLIYLTDDLKAEPIQTAEDVGRWLVGYALADRDRVSAD